MLPGLAGVIRYTMFKKRILKYLFVSFVKHVVARKIASWTYTASALHRVSGRTVNVNTTSELSRRSTSQNFESRSWDASQILGCLRKAGGVLSRGADPAMGDARYGDLASANNATSTDRNACP
jgi:hypothetical protein